MRAVLKAQINKTDRNDARGMAQMMRVGLRDRPVHVEDVTQSEVRMLLTHRKLLQSKAIAIDNDLRGTLRNLVSGWAWLGTAKFEARIKELVENLPDLAMLVEPLLVVRRVLREQIGVLHRRLLAIVRDDDVRWRLTDGSRRRLLWWRWTLLRHRRTCQLALRTPRRSGRYLDDALPALESGESDRPGSASRCGDEMRRDDALRSGPDQCWSFRLK